MHRLIAPCPSGQAVGARLADGGRPETPEARDDRRRRRGRDNHREVYMEDTTRPARRLAASALMFLASLALLAGCTQVARTASQVEQRAAAVVEQQSAAT